MKQLYHPSKQQLSLLLALVILMCTLLFGCQPTPEKEIVVSKKEAVPSKSIIEDGGDAKPHTYLEPVEYEVLEHWADSIQQTDQILIEADVDVRVPKVEKYPVQKVEPLLFSQEQADRMIYTFVKEGTKFFVWPEPKTKAEFEQELIEAKRYLSEAEHSGDKGFVKHIESDVKRIEENLASAPDVVERQYLGTTFDYPRDYETGQPQTDLSPNTIELTVEDENREAGHSIFVSNFDSKDPYSSTSFNYMGNIREWNQTTYEYEVSDLEQSNRSWETTDEDNPYMKAQLAYLKEKKKEVDAVGEQLAKNNIDLAVFKQKAQQLLDGLGISGMQIQTCEKAVYKEFPPLQNNWNTPDNYTAEIPDKNACSITFVRECGGIPCAISPLGDSIGDAKLEAVYSSPFYVEEGHMLLAEDGTVLSFYWNGGAAVVEQVADNTELLPFDEIKQRIAEKIVYDNTYYYDEDYPIEENGSKLRCVIDEVRLAMTYINAKDDPHRALIVPVWEVVAKVYPTYMDESGNEIEGNHMGDYSILINALDGGFVSMPQLQEMKLEMEQSGPYA